MKRVALILLTGLFCLTISGCKQFSAATDHGSTLAYYRDRLLPTSSSDGKRRLQIEKAVDPRLSGYLEDHGEPEYFIVEGLYSGKLYYVGLNKTVSFERPWYALNSSFTESSGLPAAVLRREKEIQDRKEAPKRPVQSVLQGTGFFIDKDKVATAYHVIRDAEDIHLLVDTLWVKAELVFSDSENDLAVLQCVRSFPGKGLPVSRKSPGMGDRCFSIGFPAIGILGLEPKYTEGVVSALPDGLLQVTVPIQPGSSGSPLISEKGEVIGIIVSTIAGDRFIQKAGALPQNVNFAAPAVCLPERYVPVQDQPQKLDRAGMIKKLSESICLVKAAK